MGRHIEYIHEYCGISVNRAHKWGTVSLGFYAGAG